MKTSTPSKNPVSRAQRHRDAIKLHEIEGNPFTPEDNAVFDMFEREGWTGEQRREYIVGEARRRGMNGESLDEQLYLYPGTKILRNRLGIQDAEALDYAERMLVRDRMAQGCPGGDFDLDHLQAIHRHLFQDVYD